MWPNCLAVTQRLDGTVVYTPEGVGRPIAV